MSEIESADAAATRPRRPKSWLRRFVLLLMFGFVLLIGAWAADSALHRDQVGRNVSAGGLSLDHFTEDEVRFAASELTRSLENDPLTLTIDDQVVATNPVQLGTQVDADALAVDALAANRSGFVLLAPFRWAKSLFSPTEVALRYRTDPAAVVSAVEDITFQVLDPPIEPRLRWGVNRVQFVEGKSGTTVSADELAEALPATIESGQPYTLELSSFEVTPKNSPEQLWAVESELNNALRWPMEVEAAGQRITIEASQLSRWVNLVQSPEPDWTINERQALADLEPMFKRLGDSNAQPQMVVVMDKPLIVPTRETLLCCGEGLKEVLRKGLLTDRSPSDNPPPPVDLPLRTDSGQFGLDDLASLGVVEQVSTFTTSYPCCRNRVTNIHLFSDILRGALILPGEELSLNEHVGMRTPEKGFLPDGAIAKGVLEAQVGGGVSQVASTFFSTAFFAGLDFEEYQSHSLYFSRYERGREATISWPKPDLRVANYTDYAVLVWPTYTDTTLTIAMYSTKHIDVKELGRRDSPVRQCTKVTTTRERTYPDDVVVTDSVFGVYRPGEGLDCNGNPTS